MAGVKEGPHKTDVWLKCYLDSDNRATFLNKTASAVAAGFDGKDIQAFRTIGCQEYKRNQKKIKKWMKEEGLTEDRMRAKLVKLMEAQKTVHAQHEGRFTDERQVEALEIQRDALKMGLQVLGMFAPEQKQITGAIATETGLSVEAKAMLQDLIDTVEEGFDFLR